MSRCLLALVGMLAAGSAANAQLKLEKIEACHGAYGAARTSLNYQPGERVWFRFLITGMTGGPGGEVAIHANYILKDANGSEVGAGKQLDFKDRPTFGNCLPAEFILTLPLDQKPGDYTLTAEVTDTSTSQTIRFERQLHVLPSSFAITMPVFFYDEGQHINAPPGGLLGQDLYFDCNIFGIDNSSGKVDVQLKIEVLNARTREVVMIEVTPPLDRCFLNEVAGMRGSLCLNCVGDFILRLTATDRVDHKTATVEVPLKVLPSWPSESSK